MRIQGNQPVSYLPVRPSVQGNSDVPDACKEAWNQVYCSNNKRPRVIRSLLMAQVGFLISRLHYNMMLIQSGGLGSPRGSGSTGYSAISCPIPNQMGSYFRYGLQIYSSCFNKPQIGHGELLESRKIGKLPRIIRQNICEQIGVMRLLIGSGHCFELVFEVYTSYSCYVTLQNT